MGDAMNWRISIFDPAKPRKDGKPMRELEGAISYQAKTHELAIFSDKHGMLASFCAASLQWSEANGQFWNAMERGSNKGMPVRKFREIYARYPEHAKEAK